MKGPSRSPLSKRVTKKPVIHPVSQLSTGTGVIGDKRPTGTDSNLQRAQWGIKDRQDTGDWKEA